MIGPSPYQNMRAAQHWRLMFSLLFAAAVHILAIALLPLPRVPSALLPTPALEVRLAPSPDETRGSTTANATPAREARRVSPKPQSTNRFDVREESAPAAVTLERPAAASSSPSMSMDALLDAAKGIVRDEARRMPPPDKEEPGIADRPMLPRLAHALKKQPAGETRLASGTIKVVTLSGTVYCLQPPPEAVVRISSITPIIVPTNCP